MKDLTLIILILAVFVGGALFILVSGENRDKAPNVSAPQLPSSSMKASVLDSNKATTTPRN
ncbi:MAG: hypothetical protein NUV64_01895 [Parcubacteria group bacterium]|nr:hypothetical protein [Parcubacteria group bacterium]MCR4343116.1 hypothetical protein [Patescibacteria group bacterium]